MASSPVVGVRLSGKQGGDAPSAQAGRPSGGRFGGLAAHWRTFWPVLVGAVVVAAGTGFPVRGAVPSSDQSVYAYVGWMITRGHMPYTDAWDNKGPLTYLLYAVGTGLDPDHGMFVVSVVNLLVVGVLAYRVALRLARPAMAGVVTGVALGALVHSPELTEALSLGFLLYLTLVAVRVLVDDVAPTPVQAVLVGGCAAASTLLRANNAFVMVPLGLAVGVWLARRSVATLARTLGWLVVGAVVVTAPVVVWLWRGGALGAGLDAAYVGSLTWDLSWATRLSNTSWLVVGYGVGPLVVWSALLVGTVRAGRAARQASRTSPSARPPAALVGCEPSADGPPSTVASSTAPGGGHQGRRWLSWGALGGLGVFVVANVAGPGTGYSHYLVVLFPLTLVAALVVLGAVRDRLAGGAATGRPRRGVALVVAVLVLVVPQVPGVLGHVAYPYDTGGPDVQRRALVAYVQRTTAPDDKVLMLDFGIFGAQYRRESPTPYYPPDALWGRSTQERVWRDIAADALADPPALVVFGDEAERARFLGALPAETRADVQTLLAAYRAARIGDYVVYTRLPQG